MVSALLRARPSRYRCQTRGNSRRPSSQHRFSSAEAGLRQVLAALRHYPRTLSRFLPASRARKNGGPRFHDPPLSLSPDSAKKLIARQGHSTTDAANLAQSPRIARTNESAGLIFVRGLRITLSRRLRGQLAWVETGLNGNLIPERIVQPCRTQCAVGLRLCARIIGYFFVGKTRRRRAQFFARSRWGSIRIFRFHGRHLHL